MSSSSSATPEPQFDLTRTEMPLYGDKGNGSFSAKMDPLRSFLRPRVCCSRLWHFLVHWLSSRPWILFVSGAPALLVAMLGGVVAGMHHLDRHRIPLRYEHQLAEAMRAEDWQRSSILIDRLLSLRPEHPQYLFQRAIVHHHRGNVGLANLLIADLAPEDHAGLPAAHFEVARRAIGAGDFERAEKHLRHAIVKAPGDPTLHGELGKVLLARGNREDALVHFERALQIDPRLGLTVGQLYSRAGLPVLAQTVWQNTATHFAKSFIKSGDRMDLLQQVQALVFADNFAAGEKALLNAAARLGKEEIRQPLASLYTAKAARHGEREQWSEQWEALSRALTVRPQHEAALVAVAKLMRTERPESIAARQRIRDLLGAGGAPAAVHLVIGTMDAQQGQWRSARLHLEQARERDPRMPIALNNLAWVMFQEEPEQAEDALRLINEAERLAPNTAAILDTRAAIRLQMGDAIGAIRDLEDALRLAPQRVTYMRRLGEAYAAAGDPESAKAILRRIEQAGGATRPGGDAAATNG